MPRGALKSRREAMAAAQQSERRRRGTQHLDAERLLVGARRGACEGRRGAQGFGLARAGGDDRREPAEGRQAVGFPSRSFLRHERVSVASGERRDHRVLGGVGLEHDPAGASAAPGAPAHLMEQLVCALGRAHITAGEA